MSCDQISRQLGAGDCRHTFMTPRLAPNDAMIEGRFLLRRLKSGVVVHATDAVDLHELTTEHVADPELTIFLVLDGVVDFLVDGHPFVAASRHSRHANADCMVVVKHERATVIRRGRKGSRTRKVAVSVDRVWLDELAASGGAQLRRMRTTHLAHAACKASPRLLALAEQILNPANLCPFLRELYIESRSLEVVADVLATLADTPSPTVAADARSTREVLKARAARDYIEANLDKPLTLADIAQAVGLSVTSLQHKFKAAYGTTVVELLRARKLERARQALETGAMTVGEAAFLAGYATPANFTTAFRRAFGVPPSALRR